MGKETVEAQFNRQSRYLDGRIEENHGAPAKTGAKQLLNTSPVCGPSLSRALRHPEAGSIHTERVASHMWTDLSSFLKTELNAPS
jgi:hypothetical protein